MSPVIGVLAACPLFAGLEPSLLESFLREHRVLLLPAGHQVVFEGDWSDGAFLLRSGIAKVRHITLSGEEVVIALLGAGEIFGELSLLPSNSHRSADVVSLTPIEVVKLRLEPMERALRTEPAFALAMARLQAWRLRRLGHRLGLRGEDATTRVLATLLELACCGSQGGDPLSSLPDLSQSELAAIAGLARGTASKVLTRLRSRGTVVASADGLRIADLEPLRRRGLLPPEPGRGTAAPG
ncbi:MAG: Crp/Fnr family transcriptional regulator [Synechococcaceae cyanobacterium]|nr:Crp/Fnr family transcriptional regulator [Synechococcaceae cyanobacterium]